MLAYIPSNPELIWKSGVYMTIKIKTTSPPNITRNKDSITFPITVCWCSISSEYCLLSLSMINLGSFAILKQLSGQ